MVTAVILRWRAQRALEGWRRVGGWPKLEPRVRVLVAGLSAKTEMARKTTQTKEPAVSFGICGALAHLPILDQGLIARPFFTTL